MGLGETVLDEMGEQPLLSIFSANELPNRFIKKKKKKKLLH